jgi:serine/threonine-protein kinase RsbT
VTTARATPDVIPGPVTPMPNSRQARVPIRSDIDIVVARQKGRALAAELDFSPTDVVRIATAISELARNVLSYATSGEIRLQAVENRTARGITIVAQDNGPGIANVEQALQDGYSTSGGLGLGLPGVRRLMDDFRIESTVGTGTTVTVTKWHR